MQGNHGDDHEFMADLRREFLENAFENLKKMSHDLARGNLTTVAQYAHDIKGTAGIFGFDEAGIIARELNIHAKAGDFEKTSLYMKKLESFFAGLDQ